MASSDVISIDVLPGNWMASQLRSLCNDTQSLLHHRQQSREASHQPGPFFSLFEIDFGGAGSKMMVVDGAEGIVRLRKDKPLNLFARTKNTMPAKMFQTWRVPKRITEIEEEGSIKRIDPMKIKSPAISTSQHNGILDVQVTGTKGVQVTQKMDDLKIHPELYEQDFDAKMPTPTPVHVHHTENRPISKIHSMASFPQIKKPQTAMPGYRSEMQLPQSTMPSITRSATVLGKAPSVDSPKSAFKHMVNMPSQEMWKKQYSKKVIEKAIRQTNKFANVDNVLANALLPDVKMSALKWLDQASEQERQVALEFFQSVSGTKLMGTSNAEQMLRLDQVLQTLKTGRPIGVQLLPRYQHKAPSRIDNETRLQYLRLLSPTTRKNKSHHTTWHHLPVYRDRSIVENTTSILTEPHRTIPRHFNIHPDWG